MQTVFINSELVARLPELIDSAKTSIRLAMYQLSPVTPSSTPRLRQVWAAMHQATTRGVICSAVIHAGSRNLPGQQAAQMAARDLQDIGWAVKLCDGGKIMHSKAMLIDGRHLLAGSHNWTESGLYNNGEVSIWYEDCPDAAQFAIWHSRRMMED